MIYISSSCIKTNSIKETVTTLANAGFKNIELSGGTRFYPEYETDLLQLQKKYELNFLVHNYFPPPTKPFVLNLASLNDDIYKQSIDLCKNAIRLSKKLGSRCYSVHAGFLIDIKPKEVGKKISFTDQFDREKAIKRFCNAWNVLCSEACDDVSLYIENNVLSWKNAKTFSGDNPFLLTDLKGYIELKEHLDFNFLLDIAHLKVSSNSLNLNFETELNNLLPLTDYIHMSDNDGYSDSNNYLNHENELFKILGQYNFKNKTISLEIYENIEKIIDSYDTVVHKLKLN